MQECSNCGHDIEEHSQRGYCMHYKHGSCICSAFITSEEATPEMRANRLFGRMMWHSTYTFKKAFAGGACNHKQCPAAATRRIMVNIWGSVCEYDVCEEHGAEYHGKLLDEFPARPLIAIAEGAEG
jgi:hypothetical protein